MIRMRMVFDRAWRLARERHGDADPAPAARFDGFDVCKKLREGESTRAVPIIVISALTDDESKQRALDAGATAYYTKPFSPTALLKELETIQLRESARMSARPPRA